MKNSSASSSARHSKNGSRFSIIVSLDFVSVMQLQNVISRRYSPNTSQNSQYPLNWTRVSLMLEK